MIGEALPDLAPGLHAEACDMMRYEGAWVRKRDEWLAEASVGMTNVLALRPPDNKIESLCVKKGELPHDYPYPPLSLGQYLREEFLPELSRLRVEMGECNPKLVVALGNTACWALLRATNIGSIRGTTALSYDPVQTADGERQLKVIPTYHPAGVMRNWSWRSIVVADLMKAGAESAFAEIRRPAREVVINPTLQEIANVVMWLVKARPKMIAWDTETGAGMIKCISFAWARNQAICIPFINSNWTSYWASHSDEVAAWKLISDIFALGIPMLAQNGLYDLQYLMPMGILPRTQVEDTMLLHHSIFPEMQKGLGFLGSIYSAEASWKLMRTRKADTEKRDE